jgi:cysteine-rich repeat protein
MIIAVNFAQANCCCLNEEPYYSYGQYVDQAACSSLNGSFYTVGDAQECITTCAPPCPSLSCESAITSQNISCSCGQEIVSELGSFCCAASQTIYVDQDSCLLDSACAPLDNTYSITGYIFDLFGQPISSAVISSADYTGSSNEEGYYSIQNVPEANEITISAQAAECSGVSQIVSFTEDAVVDFYLECQITTEECGTGMSCCAADEECADPTGEYVGQRDCATGYSCYDYCSSCTSISSTQEGCDFGECSTTDNAYCDVNEDWVYYDIYSDENVFDDYCSLCGELDADCLNRPCQSDNACNGVCPINCGPGDDPDCGLSCDTESNSWCDSYGVEDWTTDDYCSHCYFADPEECPSNCGNTILESGEQCDDGNQQPNDGCDENCQIEDTETGCNPNGQVELPAEECDPELDWIINCPSPAYTGCNNQCQCIPACSFEKQGPNSLGLGHVPQSSSITVNWDYPNICFDLFEEVKVMRCEGANCNNFYSLNTITDVYTTQFTDESIIAETTYKYYVSLKYSDGYEWYNSEIVEITTGHEDCLNQHQESFCRVGFTDKFECDNDNQLLTTTCVGYCFTPSSGDAYCLGSGPCDDCNSIYGMFADFALQSQNNDFKVEYTDISGSINDRTCYDITYNFYACYLKKTDKSVENLESCVGADSCYNYLSSESCDEASNPCGKFIDGQGEFQCSWESYPDIVENEIDLGICHPNNPVLQNCGLCNEDNSVFAGVCNYDVCNLFGDCYFDEGQKGCAGINDIFCSDYNNEADCTGGNNFELDALNNVITISDDYFGYGKCKWDENSEQCYRDANDDSPTEPTTENPERFDCLDDPICKKDFDSPTTYVNGEEGSIFGKEFNLSFAVIDEIYSLSNLTAYYCISTLENCNNATTYMEIDLSNENIEKAFIRTFPDSENNNETFTLNYYSQDFAKNLELVKTFDFFIDGKDPLLTFSYEYNSYETAVGWFNDVVTILSADEQVICDLTLKNSAGEEQGENIENITGTDFQIAYNQLVDGTYWFNIDCEDMRGNKADLTQEQITVEGDKSITNPSPEYEKFDVLSIDISVETINEGDCRYSTQTYQYENMHEIFDAENHVFSGSFDSEDNLYHTKTLELYGSGVYKLYTACNISYEKTEGTVWEVTEGNDGDWIVFSIDKLKPVTALYNKETNDEFDESRYYRSLELEFVCKEPNWYSDDNGNTWGMTLGESWDGSFGCEELILCEGQGCNPTSVSDTNELKILPEAGITEKDYIFYFYSKDIENTEDLRTATIHIDSVDSNISLITMKENNVVETLSYGDYDLIAESTKSIQNVVRFSYKILYDDNSQSSTFSLLPTTINNEYSFQSSISVNTNLFYNKIGEIQVVIEVEDNHGLRTTETFNLPFNTQGPPPPIPEPMFNVEKLIALTGTGLSFKDSNNNFYPFIYYDSVTLADDSYYQELTVVRDENFFVTGYTSDIQGDVLIYRIKGTGTAYTPTYSYEQTMIPGAVQELETKPLKFDAYKNSDEIIIDTTQELVNWGAGYINFEPLSSDKGLIQYMNYGKFYTITSSEFLGAATGHKITFSPSLEKDLSQENNVYLYDKDRSQKWFGQDINLEYSPSDNNLYNLVFGLDDSLNIGMSPYYSLYIDNSPLRATNVFPIGGTITNKFYPLIIEFEEDPAGSGLKEDSIKFIIDENGESTTKTIETGITLTELGIVDGYRKYNAEYLPVNGWDDANYNITIQIEDQAGNELDTIGFFDEQILFVFDSNAPSNPLFNVISATDDNIDNHGRIVVDNSNPSFELDFTMNANGSVESLDITPAVLGATCSLQTKNFFTCNFNNALSEQMHELSVSANKILPNGSLGPEGIYMQDSDGKPLTIIVDHTAPSFTLQPEKEYLAPNESITVYADVNNEEYDLWATISTDEWQTNVNVEEVDDSRFFIIPETFYWGEDGEKIVEVRLKDFAGHETAETTTITIDSTPPAVIIQAIEADYGFLIPNTDNATVGTREITIIGTVDDDSYSLCYTQESGGSDCIFECSGEQEDCISRVEGRDEFRLTLIIQGENSMETLNNVFMTVTDYSGHETTSSLFVLLDLVPPGEPTIIIE